MLKSSTTKKQQCYYKALSGLLHVENDKSTLQMEIQKLKLDVVVVVIDNLTNLCHFESNKKK